MIYEFIYNTYLYIQVLDTVQFIRLHAFIYICTSAVISMVLEGEGVLLTRVSNYLHVTDTVMEGTKFS